MQQVLQEASMAAGFSYTLSAKFVAAAMQMLGNPLLQAKRSQTVHSSCAGKAGGKAQMQMVDSHVHGDSSRAKIADGGALQAQYAEQWQDGTARLFCDC